MADFEREAELSIVIPSSELRDARQEIEDALADIPVGVSGSGGGGGAGGGGGSAREQRRRRREFRWARQRTDDVATQVEILENIDNELSEGLGGGGGAFSELIGLGGEGAGIAADVGSTLVEALPSALGSLVGTAVGQQLGGGGGGGGGGGAASTARPEWVPLQTERPNWVPIPVEEPGDGFLPEFDIPDLPELPDPPDLSVETPPDAGFEQPPVVPIAEPPALTVEKPDWVPIQVQRPGGRQPTRPPSGDTGGDGGQFGIGPFSETDLNRRITTRANELVPDPIRRGIERLPGSASQQRGGGGTRGRSSGAPATVATGDVNVTVQTNVQNAVQDAVDRLRQEQDRQRQQLRRDLERQIGNLSDQINSATGGRGGIR